MNMSICTPTWSGSMSQGHNRSLTWTWHLSFHEYARNVCISVLWGNIMSWFLESLWVYVTSLRIHGVCIVHVLPSSQNQGCTLPHFLKHCTLVGKLCVRDLTSSESEGVLWTLLAFTLSTVTVKGVGTPLAISTRKLSSISRQAFTRGCLHSFIVVRCWACKHLHHHQRERDNLLYYTYKQSVLASSSGLVAFLFLKAAMHVS